MHVTPISGERCSQTMTQTMEQDLIVCTGALSA